MNISLMNDGNIYFLGFIFSPKLRTLSCGDTLYQLRKKESDVLALLCERYPHPVSQDDFLSCVWEGGYVTPQSIAQVIRALRRNLQDKDKQIIVTIPKLGYRFGV
ncbi:winged helix-turn-helix domain-containing protein, partial [Candidatus Symbiopectobacterium sp. NZEC135]|uniref:winged helix-turn-helix domain-containing protein n=1 Tax=Candidatus Symbiopectobacterium sp. NZEC135 TaxID=2820471 RepID=UPI0022273561